MAVGAAALDDEADEAAADDVGSEPGVELACTTVTVTVVGGCDEVWVWACTRAAARSGMRRRSFIVGYICKLILFFDFLSATPTRYRGRVLDAQPSVNQ
jgi:hypothetical protein